MTQLAFFTVAALLIGAADPPASRSVDGGPAVAPEAAVSAALRVSMRRPREDRPGRDGVDVTLDPATGAITTLETNASAPIILPLPGTDLSAELVRSTWNPQRDLYVVQRAEDGRELRRTLVCPLAENPRDVVWHEGWHRLIYIRGLGDGATLRSRDPRSDQEATMAVGGVADRVRMGPDHQIAASAVTDLRGKERRVDLTVFRGRATLRAVVDEPIHAFAWSADGASLIYSVPGELRICTLADRSTKTIRLEDLDERLRHHVSHTIDVARDGTIALSLRFAGGRVAHGDDPEPMHGDHEVFLLTLPGTLRAVPVGGTVTEVRWLR